MREQALNGIAEATRNIAAALGIDALAIPTQGKDADLLYAQQLQAIADYLNGVAEQVGGIQTADNRKEVPPSLENEPEFVQTVVENEPPLPEPETPDEPKTRRKGR